MSIRLYQDCPTCGAELALRQMFLPGRPDDQFVWWDRCSNCNVLLVQPSRGIQEEDDGEGSAEFVAAIREYEREEARADAEVLHNPKPCGTVPTDSVHRCTTCAYICNKGRTTQAGIAISKWCSLKQAFTTSGPRFERTLNPRDDCPDWFPFEVSE